MLDKFLNNLFSGNQSLVNSHTYGFKRKGTPFIQ